jgi:hypothetical protein
MREIHAGTEWELRISLENNAACALLKSFYEAKPLKSKKPGVHAGGSGVGHRNTSGSCSSYPA